MIKLRVTYSNDVERDGLVENLKSNFKVLNISKEYKGGKFNSIYVDIENKN